MSNPKSEKSNFESINSIEFAQVLLKTIPFGVDIVDMEGNLLYINDQLKNIVGEGNLGKKCWEVYKDSKEQCGDCPLKSNIKVGETKKIESNNVLGEKIFEISHTGLVFDGKNALLEVFHDITPKKIIENKLIESEKRYRGIFENARDALLVCNWDGQFIDVNLAACKLLGFSRQELLQLDVFDVTHRTKDFNKKQRTDMLEELRTLWRTGMENFGIVYVSKSGDLIPTEMSFSLVIFDGQEAVLGAVRDISDRKIAEEKLKESEEKFKLTIQNSPAVIETYDKNGLQIDVNKAYEELWGFSSDTTLEKFNVLKSKEVKDSGLIEYIKKAYRGETVTVPEYLFDSRGETEAQGKGRERWLSTRIYPLKNSLGEVTHIVITHEDITERKLAESESNKLKLLLEETERVSKFGGWEIDLETMEPFFTEGTYNIYELESDAPPKLQDGINYYAPEARPIITKAVEEAIENNTPYDLELPFITAKGNNIWVRAIGKPEYQNGKVIKLRGTLRDITENKRNRDKLIQSESRLSKAQEIARIGSYELDITTGLWTSSEILDEIFSIEEDFKRDVQGWLSLIDKDWQKIMQDYLAHDVLELFEVFDKEYKIVGHNSGVEKWVHGIGKLIFNSENQPIKMLGTIQDITESKQRILEMETVVNVSAAIRATESVSDILKISIEQTDHILQTLGTALIIGGDQSDKFVVEASSGIFEAQIGYAFNKQEGITGSVIESGEVYINNNSKTHPDPRDRDPEILMRANAVACIPLIAKHNNIGVLWVGRELPLSDLEVNLLKAIGNIVANAIHEKTLFEQTGKQLSRLTSLHKIDTLLNEDIKFDSTLQILIDQVILQLEVSAAAIYLYDKEDNQLKYGFGKGFRDIGKIKDIPIAIEDSLAGSAITEKKTTSLLDIDKNNPNFSFLRFLREEGFVSYYSTPLAHKKNVVGVLEVYNREVFTPSNDWVSFFETIAGQISLAIENSNLVSDYRNSLDGTIKTLAATIELRDPYTGGHQDRVSDLAAAVAVEMNLSNHQIEGIRLASQIHDLGKIQIPAEILNKPGKLTKLEFDMIKTHPQIGYDLLKDIKFPWPIAKMVYQHHERVNGSGYPNQLRGDQILIKSKILGVADVIEAMSSHRPYRPALDKSAALDEIKKGKGKLYDDGVVEAFLRVIDRDPSFLSPNHAT